MENVLSVQVRLGTTLVYFAVEFGDADALAFLAIQSQDLIDRLQQRRQQELAAYQAQKRMAG